MAALLGTPTKLATTLNGAQRAQLRDSLGTLLGVRRDRVDVMVSAVAGFTARPAGRVHTQQISQAAAAIAGMNAISDRTLRRLLEDVPVDEEALRWATTASAPLAGRHALRLEHEEIRCGEQTLMDQYSVGAIDDHAIQILDARRAVVPSMTDELSAFVDDDVRDADAVHQMLSQTLTTYESFVPDAVLHLPPVVCSDPTLGDSRLVRQTVGSVVRDYIFEIGGDYGEFRPGLDPFETTDPLRSVASLFSDWPDPANPPQPRALHSVSGAAEYAVVLPGAGERRYAIARPYIDAAPGALIGRRAHDRARELAALLARTSRASTLGALGLSQFAHHSPAGWRRMAMLIAFVAAMLDKRLPADLRVYRARTS